MKDLSSKENCAEQKKSLFNTFNRLLQPYTRNQAPSNSQKKSFSNDGMPRLKPSAELRGRGQERRKKSVIMTELEKQECE